MAKPDSSARDIVLKLAKTMDGCQAEPHVKITAALQLAAGLMDFAGFNPDTMREAMDVTIRGNERAKRIIHAAGRA